MEYKYRHRETYKDVKIDIKANSTKELVEKVKKRKERIDRLFVDEQTKLQDFADKYVASYKSTKVSPGWLADIRVIIKNKIVGELGNRPISKIKPMEIQAMLNAHSYLSDSYIKKIYDLTCQIWHNAYQNGLTSFDYSVNLECPKGAAAQIGRSLTNYERQILLDVLEGRVEDGVSSGFMVDGRHRGNLFCKIMLFCGCRPGEVRALQWRHVDLDARVLHIRQAVKKDGVIGEPKSKAGVRDIPIPDILLPELLAASADPFSFVCTQLDGRRHSETSVKKLWASVCRLMNIGMGCRVEKNQLVPPYPLQEPFKMYYLRHTYCTDLEKMGVPINIAARLMGHSDISVTSKIYTHASEESLEIARDLINGGKSRGKHFPESLEIEDYC